jgi:hypothetical protein
MRRACTTAASPSQQAITRPGAWRTMGAQARAMSSLRTMAVGRMHEQHGTVVGGEQRLQCVGVAADGPRRR